MRLSWTGGQRVVLIGEGMKLEEMEKWSKKDLRERVNGYFKQGEEAGWSGPILTEAQFYMRELENIGMIRGFR